MTRMSKQGERRAKSPRKTKPPQLKTGPKKDHLEKGFREHINAFAHSAEGEHVQRAFIPKIQ